MASSAAEAAKRSAFGGAIFLNLTPYNVYTISLTHKLMNLVQETYASFLCQNLMHVLMQVLE